MKTCGLRTLSQRVSRARRKDSRKARNASSLKQSRRSRPPGRKMSSTDPSGVAMAQGPSRIDRSSVLFDYDAPVRPTQEAIFTTEPLAVAIIPPIATSALISDGRYGNGPGASGLAFGTWDNGESATCGELSCAVEFA